MTVPEPLTPDRLVENLSHAILALHEPGAAIRGTERRVQLTEVAMERALILGSKTREAPAWGPLPKAENEQEAIDLALESHGQLEVGESFDDDTVKCLEKIPGEGWMGDDIDIEEIKGAD